MTKMKPIQTMAPMTKMKPIQTMAPSAATVVGTAATTATEIAMCRANRRLGAMRTARPSAFPNPRMTQWMTFMVSAANAIDPVAFLETDWETVTPRGSPVIHAKMRDSMTTKTCAGTGVEETAQTARVI